MSEIHVTF